MEAAEEHSDETTPDRPSRHIVRLVLVIIVVRTITAWIGDIIAPSLIPDENGEGGNPLLLILLNTRKRYLLAGKDEAVLAFFGAAMISQILMDPFFYLIGRWYGDAGVRWMERQFGSGITTIENMFKRASYPLVALMPNAYICVLAGAARMRPGVFFLLNIGGTIAAIALARWVGDVASGPLDAVFGFINRYRWWLVGFSAVVIGIQVRQNRRQASVENLEEALDEAVAEEEASREPD